VKQQRTIKRGGLIEAENNRKGRRRKLERARDPFKKNSGTSTSASRRYGSGSKRERTRQRAWRNPKEESPWGSNLEGRSIEPQGQKDRNIKYRSGKTHISKTRGGRSKPINRTRQSSSGELKEGYGLEGGKLNSGPTHPGRVHSTPGGPGEASGIRESLGQFTQGSLEVRSAGADLRRREQQIRKGGRRQGYRLRPDGGRKTREQRQPAARLRRGGSTERRRHQATREDDLRIKEQGKGKDAGNIYERNGTGVQSQRKQEQWRSHKDRHRAGSAGATPRNQRIHWSAG
jgi:hypothetical protein